MRTTSTIALIASALLMLMGESNHVFSSDYTQWPNGCYEFTGQSESCPTESFFCAGPCADMGGGDYVCSVSAMQYQAQPNTWDGVWADVFTEGPSLDIDWVRELHCYKTAGCMCVEGEGGNHICVADLRTVAEYDNRFIPVLNSDAPCTLPGGWGLDWGF
jgi:hypothetical protein